MDNLKYQFECLVCKSKNWTAKKNQKLCSKKCQKDFSGRKNRAGKAYGISPGTVGAISEIAIAKYLMSVGYSIFRSMSPSCFCDLIAVKNDEVMYLEARTGYINMAGKLFFPPLISTINGRPTHYAVYVMDNDSVTILKITDEEYKKHAKNNSATKKY